MEVLTMQATRTIFQSLVSLSNFGSHNTSHHVSFGMVQNLEYHFLA